MAVLARSQRDGSRLVMRRFGISWWDVRQFGLFLLLLGALVAVSSLAMGWWG